MKKLIVLIITAFTLANANAQNVAINADASLPNASAMLDVKNANKGLLIPRVTLTATTDVTTIPSPATSLMVYNTTAAGSGATAVTPGYYYYNGSAWVQVITSATPATSWSLIGNAGTVDGTNFIGTTDNVPFNVKVNGQKAGRIDITSNNTFWGYQAGNVTQSGQNTGIGYNALLNNFGGATNTAIGATALQSNFNGAQNSAIGYGALALNTSGNFNTAIGVNTMVSNSTGIKNTATGQNALYLSTGDFNTANGFRALYTNTTGSSNTAIGYQADVSAVNLTNATAIGANAIVNASNKVRIGDANVTVIEGQVAYTFPSDKRFKYNIQQNVPGLSFIKKLTPVTYFFDTKKLEEFTKTGVLTEGNAMQAGYSPAALQLHTGFLAQDVEKAANSLGYKFDGVHAPDNAKDHYSVAYSQFIMPLVKSVQEQQVIIEDQNKQLSNQAEMIKVMNEKLDALTKKIEGLNK